MRKEADLQITTGSYEYRNLKSALEELTVDLSKCETKEQKDKDEIMDHVIKSYGSVEEANKNVMTVVSNAMKEIVAETSMTAIPTARIIARDQLRQYFYD